MPSLTSSSVHSIGDVEIHSASKENASVSGKALSDIPDMKSRVFEAPEFLLNLSAEDRAHLESKLKRKIDLRLLPMVTIIYAMNYLDRNNIAAAKLAGLPEDLNLKGVEFQTAVSILFVGYLLIQIPSNLFLNKIGKPALFLPACMALWGMVSAATAACQKFGDLLACRFILGFLEAAYFPGCLYFLSCWYTRKELGLRTAIFYSGSMISGALSGLITAAVTSHMNGLLGLGAWRWLFIIEGGATVGIAIAAFFILPNFPRTTSWLTKEELQLAVWRLEEDVGEDDWVEDEQQSFFVGMKLAFTDIKTYILMVLLFSIVASGTVTNFFPTVVQSLAFGKTETLLLTAPPYVLAIFTTFLNAWHADRTGERFLHVAIPLLFAVFAFVLAAATTTTVPRYVAMMFMVPGVYSAYVVALAWISNTIPRPPAKRAAVLAFINTVSCTSPIYASYLYWPGAAPRYLVAMLVNCTMVISAIIAAITLRITLMRLNKKLDRGIYVKGAVNSAPPAGSQGFRFRV